MKTEKGYENIPKSSKTLLKTPRATPLNKINPGFYYHFGVTKFIFEQLGKTRIRPKSIKLAINVDGVPLTKCSGSQFYPILGLVTTIPNSKPFVIAIFHGYEKSDNANDLLEDLVNELEPILNDVVADDAPSDSGPSRPTPAP